jgi:Phage portal protein
MESERRTESEEPRMADQEYLPAPARGWDLMKAARRFGALLGGPTRQDLEPRKGAADTARLQTIQATRQRTGQERDVQERRFVISPNQIKALADQDDIIFSIRRTLRNAIGKLGWKIVPDLDGIKADLTRWAASVAANVALPGLDIEFTPQAISADLYVKAIGPLRDLIVDLLLNEGVPQDRLASNPRYRQFFQNLVSAHEAIAMGHIQPVHDLFNKPNPSAESSFRAFLNLVVDDITLFDAAAVIKNPAMNGRTLGEIYTLPGEQIEIYRNKDRSTPQPPFIAYHWMVEGQIRAVYNNDELVYLMANPQQNGYGKSAMDVLIEQMVGSRYADAYLVDWYQNNNMPFFVFDCGPQVGQEDRDAIEVAWDNRVSKGRHRGIFIANKEGVKGFMPLPPTTNKDMEVLEQLKFWANRKCAAFGLSLNDIGFTEDLHRTTADTQADLTQSRGVESMGDLVESYLNGEIVKGDMWVRDDPENPESLEGREVPCFAYRDVKFEFFTDESQQRLQKATMMAPLVMSGIASTNEARHELGYQPAEGGDELVNFTAGGIRVRDLPELPGPQQQAMGGEDEGGDMDGPDDPASLPSGQGDSSLGNPGGQVALGKGLNDVEGLALRLAQLTGE